MWTVDKSMGDVAYGPAQPPKRFHPIDEKMTIPALDLNVIVRLSEKLVP